VIPITGETYHSGNGCRATHPLRSISSAELDGFDSEL
jgi:hypothetical protein